MTLLCIYSGDLAYFDGLTEIILTAGIVLPKPGIFQEHIQFLLVLTTPVDIVILGVSFTGDLCVYKWMVLSWLKQYADINCQDII